MFEGMKSRIGRHKQPSRSIRGTGAWLSGVVILFLLIGGTSIGLVGQDGPPQWPTGPEEYHPQRILIQSKEDVSASDLNQFHLDRGSQVLRTFPQTDRIQVVHLPDQASVPEMVALYLQSGMVEFAEPDYRLYLAAEPNDPRYIDGSLWHLHNTGQSGGVADADIDAPEGWDTTRHAEEVIVAIVDTGIRYTHEDLAANMWVNPGEIADGKDTDGNGYVDDIHGINATANNGNPIDALGHGTQVAGLAGAVGSNAKGITGVAWSVRLMALRFFDDAGNGYVSDAIACIDYARKHGADIINASFGSPSYSSSLYSAINSCRSAGIILVAAAGNDGTNNDSTPFYPASYNLDNIVAVTATTRTDALASYSNYGATTVDLGAPGSDLYTTYHSSDSAYVRNSGTSLATPVTAGAFALLKARHPTDTYLEWIDRVFAAVDPLPSLQGKCVTGGRLNLANALGPAFLAEFTANPVSGEAPLSVQFSDQSHGDIVSWSWEFGDGGTSSLQNPSHTFHQPGAFTVQLTVANTGGQTSQASRVIHTIANYQIEAATFDWIDPSGMPALSLTANGVSPAQALPFPFNYYGQNHSSVYVSANGMVGFLPDGLEANNNVDLPDPSPPNGMLCPWWDDLDPESGGSVHVGMVGSAPERRYVVSWVGVPHRSPGRKASFTFQAVLEESSQRIVFQYLNVDSGHSRGAGKTATVGVEDQAGTVAARYSHMGSTLLQDRLAIGFVPASVSPMGSLAVTPTSGLSASGTVGGPFSPTEATYTLSNTGDSAIDWTAAKSADWISLSATSGSLEPGASVAVTVAFHSTANDLSAGTHNDTVSFINATNGTGNTTRSVTLTVELAPGVLAVTPTSGLSASGTVGGPFSPTAASYTLSNTGDSAIDWTAAKSADWISLSSTSGSLQPGASVAVTVSFNSTANDLSAGTHNDTVSFTNATNGTDNTTRSVTLTVDPAPGVLAVSPTSGLSASGTVGGPFSPGEATYTLSNTGDTAIDWTAGKTADWISLSSTSGSLQPDASVAVTVSLNSAANDLSAGTHNDTVSFTNATNGTGNTTRSVTLTVDPAPGVLAVSPTSGLSASGMVGGPFSPGEATYTLSNTGDSAIDWTAGKTADWISLSATSGSLEPGASVAVTVAFHSTANDLPSGTHNDTVSFTNATNGTGNTTRSVTLTVDPVPVVLAVTPTSELSASGSVGGPFSPTEATYTLSNTGDSAIDWTAGKTADWISLSATSGSLEPGASVAVAVSFHSTANDLPAGTHNDTVSFINATNGTEDATLSVALTVWQRPSLKLTRSLDPSGWIIQVFGQPEQTITIQASADMTSWAVLHTATLGPNGSIEYLDGDATIHTHGLLFYRALVELPE
jgi:subtilisin family serine protease